MGLVQYQKEIALLAVNLSLVRCALFIISFKEIIEDLGKKVGVIIFMTEGGFPLKSFLNI